MLYYVTKQVLPVLSRALIVQDVDVWKWFNELPLQSLKQCCFPKTNLFSVETKSAQFTHNDSAINNYSKLLQEASKLQNLNDENFKTSLQKMRCCGSINCTTTDCRFFWDRFNFEHSHAKQLLYLRQRFDLEF